MSELKVYEAGNPGKGNTVVERDGKKLICPINKLTDAEKKVYEARRTKKAKPGSAARSPARTPPSDLSEAKIRAFAVANPERWDRLCQKVAKAITKAKERRIKALKSELARLEKEKSAK